MAGILGLGSDGSTGLSTELIDQLKKKDIEAHTSTIDLQTEVIDANLEIINNIDSMISTFQSSIITMISNSLDKEFSQQGSSVIISSSYDSSQLDEGITYFNVSSLAQKDVFQSQPIGNIEETIDHISISVNGSDYTFSDITYVELNNLLTEAGLKSELIAVSDEAHRLIIKSEDTGLSNSIDVYSDDLEFSQVLEAKNASITIDGINIESSSNNISYNNLDLYLQEEEESVLSIMDSNSSSKDDFSNFIEEYNVIYDYLETVKYDESIDYNTRSTINSIQLTLKNSLFYEGNNIFEYGAEIDQNGSISISNIDYNDNFSEFWSSLSSNIQMNLVDINTQIDSDIDYLDTKSSDLEQEKEDTFASLEEKYETMNNTFAQYTAIITQMEASFASLKLMMNIDD